MTAFVRVKWEAWVVVIPAPFRDGLQQPAAPARRSSACAVQLVWQEGCGMVVGRPGKYLYGDGYYPYATIDEVQGGAGWKHSNGEGKGVCRV